MTAREKSPSTVGLYPDAEAQGRYVVVRDGRVEAAGLYLDRALRLLEAISGAPTNDRLGQYDVRRTGRRWTVSRGADDQVTLATQREAVAYVAASLSAEARSLANRLAAYYGEMRLAVVGVLEQVALHGVVEGSAMDRLSASIGTTAPGARLLFDVLEGVEQIACPGTREGASVLESLRSLNVLDEAALLRAQRAIDDRRREG